MIVAVGASENGHGNSIDGEGSVAEHGSTVSECYRVLIQRHAVKLQRAVGDDIDDRGQRGAKGARIARNQLAYLNTDCRISGTHAGKHTRTRDDPSTRPLLGYAACPVADPF